MPKPFSPELIERIQTDYANMAGIVVIQNRECVYEQYFHGYDADDMIHIASVTKSVMSMLVGIAIDKGFIKSVTQHVLAFFPDYQVKQREKNIQQVTIEHLLTMTASYKYKGEPYTKVYSSDDWTTSVLDLLGGKHASEDFKYTTVGLQVLSGILVNATGKTVLEFATEHLFEPLGIKKINSHPINTKDDYMSFIKGKHVSGWVTDPQGVHTSGWGLALTTSDMATLGQLYLQNGKWNNQQIISSEWVRQSTQKHSVFDESAYGYLWWIIDNKSHESYAAIGDGGNIIFVDTARDLVVAITSQFKARVNDRVDFIKQHILPMI